ncbi:MAG: GNAT family N-acetyltransferase [Clostridiales bacterium]|nr:GNAT family N-acetyltransferase [Clostridiales bacterium]
MIYQAKTFLLKNQLPCILRNPDPATEAQTMLSYLKEISSETSFLLRSAQDPIFTVEEEKAFLRNYNLSPRNIMIIAQINDEITASASFSSSFLSKVCHRAEMGIAVRKKYWGLGLGTLLMQELCQCASQIGVTQMELEVFENNHRAKALYEKCGFSTYGIRPKASREENGSFLSHYLMVKELS